MNRTSAHAGSDHAFKRLPCQAYHVFIHAGVVCQGLLQYLAVAFPGLVWNSFDSWLRTIRPGRSRSMCVR